MFNYDQDIQPDIILMDFTKAFDKVPYKTSTLQVALVWHPIQQLLLHPVIFK